MNTGPTLKSPPQGVWGATPRQSNLLTAITHYKRNIFFLYRKNISIDKKIAANVDLTNKLNKSNHVFFRIDWGASPYRFLHHRWYIFTDGFDALNL